GRVTKVNIQTTEKVPRRFRLLAQGTSAHGSVPRLDNPLTHLSAAVAKAATWQMPMRLNETTHAYFDKLATISPPDKAARYRALLSRSSMRELRTAGAGIIANKLPAMRSASSP